MILVYFKQLKKPHIRFGIILMTISVIITTSFVIIQYSSISGFNDFAEALGIEFWNAVVLGLIIPIWDMIYLT